MDENEHQEVVGFRTSREVAVVAYVAFAALLPVSLIVPPVKNGPAFYTVAVVMVYSVAVAIAVLLIYCLFAWLRGLFAQAKIR